MGESYLRRKVLNRMRVLHPMRSSNNNNTATQQNSTSGAMQDSKSGSETSITSLPEQQRCDAVSQEEETRHPLRSLGNSQESGDSNRSTYSKIKSASKALLFFRRIGSAPQANQRHHNHLPSGALNGGGSGGSSWRSTSPPLPGARTEAEAGVASQPQLASSTTTHHSDGRLLEEPRRKRDGEPASAAATPPQRPQAQFIVPKVNTLKLPFVCLIKSLDGQLMREVFVHRYEKGQYLIESLKVSVGLVDSKYFGLRLANSVDDQDDPRNVWLNLNESVCKQLKGKHLRPVSSTGSRSIDFYLRIKFYPPSVARIQDQFLRNYLWLQLRRDLSLGKLTSSMNNLTLLMACVLQYELGDHSPHQAERVQELNILPNQDLIEEQAVELWRADRLRGSRRHQVQMQFLRTAVILETYGFDYYSVRDHQRQRAYLLGFNYAGLKTVRNGRIVHHFSWHSLNKISYERRMIIFHIHPTEVSKRKQILGFKCLSDDECQSLYMRLLEQKYFFTVDLAYFDKSFLRPACLYEGTDEAETAALAAAATANNGTPMQRSALSRATSTSSGYPGSMNGGGAKANAPCGPITEPVQCLDPQCTDATICPCVYPKITQTDPQAPGTCYTRDWQRTTTTTRTALQRQQATFRRGSSMDYYNDRQQSIEHEGLLSDEDEPDSLHQGEELQQQEANTLSKLALYIRTFWCSLIFYGPLLQSPQVNSSALEQHTHRKWLHRVLEFCLLVICLNLLLKFTDLLSNSFVGLVAYLLLSSQQEHANVTNLGASQSSAAAAAIGFESTSAG